MFSLKVEAQRTNHLLDLHELIFPRDFSEFGIQNGAFSHEKYMPKGNTLRG